jgi:hypothetical protein
MCESKAALDVYLLYISMLDYSGGCGIVTYSSMTYNDFSSEESRGRQAAYRRVSGSVSVTTLAMSSSLSMAFVDSRSVPIGLINKYTDGLPSGRIGEYEMGNNHK